MKLLTVFIGLLFSLFVLNKSTTTVTKSASEIKHKLQINHPGKENGEISNVILVEIQNKKGLAMEYYMDVESVICAEEVCKVVAVRLFWDEIGTYKKYELAENITLEKYDGKPFEKSDYLKLDTILAKGNSPFKEFRIEEILNTVVSYDDGTPPDAVSGATLIQIDANETIDGAALTCFTLWHWVNGEVQSKIRQISSENFKEQDFISYLNNGSLQHKMVALEQLILRKNYSKKLIESVIQQSNKNKELLKTAIIYFENGSSEIYFEAIGKLFENEDEPARIAIFNSLLKTTHKTPVSFYDKISKEMQSSTSFQEISMFFRLLEKQQTSSKTMLETSFLMLKKDLMISRRTYWFLKEQSLNNDQKRQLDSFYIKNKDKIE